MLHKWGLVTVEANEVAASKDAHDDTQGVEGQAAAREVAGPPGAKANEEQVVHAGESGRQGDP